MNEKQPPQGGQEPLAAAPQGASASDSWDSLMPGQRAPGPPLLVYRRRQAWWGGIFAGIAIAIALAVVMHVVQQLASPISGSYGILGSVILVLLLGPVIGFGLGMGFAASVPETPADSAPPNHSKPIHQPQAPSA